MKLAHSMMRNKMTSNNDDLLQLSICIKQHLNEFDKVDKLMKKVTNDIEILSFNTAISALMVLTNHLQSSKNGIPKEAIEKLILMVSPFAPHLGEECWEMIGYEETLAYYPWVEYDEALCVDDKVKIGVQINGKVRGQIEIEKDADQDAAVSEAMLVEKVKSYVDGKDIKKIIYVPGRILNIVAK